MSMQRRLLLLTAAPVGLVGIAIVAAGCGGGSQNGTSGAAYGSGATAASVVYYRVSYARRAALPARAPARRHRPRRVRAGGRRRRGLGPRRSRAHTGTRRGGDALQL